MAKEQRHHPEHTGLFIAEYSASPLPLVSSLSLACLASGVRWSGNFPYGYDLVKPLGHILRLWFLLPNRNSALWTSLVKAAAKYSGKNCLDSSCGPGKNSKPGKSHSHQELIPSQCDLIPSSHGNNSLFASMLRIVPCGSGSNVHHQHLQQQVPAHRRRLHGSELQLRNLMMCIALTAERKIPGRNRLDCLWDGPKLLLSGEKERCLSRADWISLCKSSAESASANSIWLDASRIENFIKAIFQLITWKH